MWSRGFRAVAAMAIAGLVVAGAASAQAPRQSYSDVFTTDVPGAATGRTYAIDYFDPDSPGGKPHAFSHLKVELAEGARFDTSALPYCQASDAQLIAQGPGACPAETKVGVDETVVDTGFAGPGRFFTVDFNFFNNRDELVLLATVRENGARVVVRGQIGERTLDIENPMVPGTPPDGGAAKSQRGRFEPRATVVDGGQSNYLTTPPTCPASGHWVNRVTYTYRDGVEQTAQSKSPCRRPAGRADERAPRIRAFGIPRRCATRSFRAHVRVTDDSRLRSVRVLLDGRAIATSPHRRVGAGVPAGRLRAGHHTIGAVATDAAGNRAERTYGFRRCGR